MKYDIDSINKRKKNIEIIQKILEIVLIIIIYNMILTFISSNNLNNGIGLFGNWSKYSKIPPDMWAAAKGSG